MGIKGDIISAVQKKADTDTQKIDAAIVSRVASLVFDELSEVLKKE